MKTWIVHAIAIAAAAAAFGASAQVKVFERPPTLEELRASMAAQSAAPAAAAAAESSGAAPRADDGSGSRRRGIVWNTPAKPSAEVVAQTAQGGASAGGSTSPGIALPIGFEPGSSRLASGANAYIDPIASLLRADPSIRLAIEGHTDASGSAQRNLMLSWDRAMTVFKLLVERYGIDPARLQPVGKGSMELMDGGNPEGAVNRRVQFRPITG